MKFNIHGSKVKITKPIKSYIEEKLGRLDKYFENPEEITANVHVRISGLDQIVEVTIPAHKIILRREERDKDLYAAIDLVCDKLERQIRKNKTRMTRKPVKPNFADFNISFEVDKQELSSGKIVKRKKLEMKPMDEEEAILQMELLGHDFYVFKNIDKDGKISVLYRRKNNDYGIIEEE